MKAWEPLRLADTQSDAGRGQLAAAIREARCDSADPAQLQRLAQRLEHALACGHTPVERKRARAWRLGGRHLILSLLLAGAGLWLGLQPAATHAPSAMPRLSPAQPKLEITAPAVPASTAEHTVPAAESGSAAAHARGPAKPPQRALKRTPTQLDELGLLTQAQAALGGDAARSLALTEEHSQRFAAGVFAEEREMLAIEALQKLRRRAAALTRARAFVRDYPHSTHARRVQALLATGVDGAPER